MSVRKRLTLYHDASRGGQKQWSIWIEDGIIVCVEWGLVGMKLQTSRDMVGTKGVEGTKSFKSQEQVAQETYDRLVRKKREAGYMEHGATVEEKDYLTALDKHFVPAKPENDVEQDELEDLFHQGVLQIQRKRDGRRHLVLITRTGDVRIYSRRMEELTSNLPRLREGIKFLRLPHGSILDGELIVDRAGHDDFRATATFTNSKTDAEKSSAREAELPVRFMVFDVLWWGGEPVWQLPYHERFRLLSFATGLDDGTTLQHPTVLTCSLREAQETAKTAKWEGLVMWRLNEPTNVRTAGGPPKRAGAIKWKPIAEKDVIATGYEMGSGNMSDRIGALYIQEYAPDGSIRDCGKVGTGFDMQTRKDALKWKYPVVISVEYDKQEPEGKLRFPVFMKLHEDKVPEDCIGPELDADE